MPNPNVRVISTATDSLFKSAETDPLFGDVFAKRADDGTTLEGVFVPYTLAIRGFPEMQDFERPYLGLRRIKDSGLVIVRHIIEVALEEPLDIDRRGGVTSTEQFIIDGDRVFNKLGREHTLSKKTRDISQPLEPGKELKLAGDGQIDRFAEKMLVVVGAAASSNTISVTQVAESA